MLVEKWHLVKRVNADIHVNSSARRLIVFLLDRENSKTKALFPSQERLSEDTNLSVRQVIRGLKSLIENEYLEILKRGCPGRATSYRIIHMTKKVKTHDIKGKNILTELSHQSSYNPLINPVKNLINKVVKNSNANYKAAKRGLKQPYNSNEMIAQRLLQKTNDPILVEAWLKLKKGTWDEQEKAENLARHYQCLK
jgi:hypothetical protein